MMFDYIKREDALELISKCISYTSPEAKVIDFRHGEINGLNWAGDIIEAMPPANATPKWVPCEERLPSEEGVYIVYAPTYRGGSSTAKENHDGIMFSKWKNSKWSIEHGYYERPNCVLAWMPLPDPYDGERRDDEIDRR